VPSFGPIRLRKTPIRLRKTTAPLAAEPGGAQPEPVAQDGEDDTAMSALHADAADRPSGT
jgi:hypothetical protein